MGAAVSYSPLNSTQQHLLKVFSFTKSEDGLRELRSVLFDHYRNKLKVQTDDFWENNNLDASKMEEVMYGHSRVAAK